MCILFCAIGGKNTDKKWGLSEKKSTSSFEKRVYNNEVVNSGFDSKSCNDLRKHIKGAKDTLRKLKKPNFHRLIKQKIPK